MNASFMLHNVEIAAGKKEARLTWWDTRYPRARWLAPLGGAAAHAQVWQWVREVCAAPLRASFAAEARALELWLRVGAGVAAAGVPLRPPPGAEGAFGAAPDADDVVVPFGAGGAALAALACVLLAHKYDDELCTCGAVGCAPHRAPATPLDLLAECLPGFGPAPPAAATAAATQNDDVAGARGRHRLAVHMLRCAEQAVLAACTWRLDAPTLAEHAWAAVRAARGPDAAAAADINIEAWVLYLWCADHCFDAAAALETPEQLVARAVVDAAPAALLPFAAGAARGANEGGDDEGGDAKRRAVVVAIVA